MHIRVLIVDDSPLMQVGLARCLEPDPGIEVIGQADGGQEGLRMAHELRPDVILLDLQMPEVTGLVVLERLREELPEIRIVVASGFSAARLAPLALEMGAVAYFEKGGSASELRDAVTAACRSAHRFAD